MKIPSQRASPIYDKRFLREHLWRAARSMNRHEYVRFHADQLNQIATGFDFEFLQANCFHVDHRFIMDGELTNAVAYTPASAIGNYLDNQQHDDFSVLTYLNAGSALFNASLRSLEEWKDHPFYKLHCTIYDYYAVISVSYHFPHHKKTFVAFDYLRAPGLDFESGLLEEYVEYLTLPFYLGWLHVYGAICDATLGMWLERCAGMTVQRFRVLRALAEPGIVNMGQIASALDLSDRTIDRHIENAYDQLLRTENEAWSEHPGNANRILALTQAFRFFEFGTGRAFRRLPRRPASSSAADGC